MVESYQSFPRRAGDALVVDALRDRARTDPDCEVAEHPAHGRRFGLVDSALGPDGLACVVRALQHVVAVAEPAAGSVLLDTAPESPVGLRRKSLQEQRVHRALELDVELVDLALGQRRDHHARELEVLVERGDVRLVAARPVVRLRHHDVERAPARVLQQRTLGRRIKLSPKIAESR